MSGKTQIEKLRKLAKFDEKATEAYAEKWYHPTDFLGSNQDCFVSGARYQHSRDAKWMRLLLAIVEVQSEALDEIRKAGPETSEQNDFANRALAAYTMGQVESLIEKAGLK